MCGPSAKGAAVIVGHPFVKVSIQFKIGNQCMYTCGFSINANLVKEGSVRINVKLVKEELYGSFRFW